MEPLKILSPIHKASRQIERLMEPRVRDEGVSTIEGHLLTYLLSYGPCAIAELHQVFGYKRSSLTSILDRLENRSFLARKMHPSDRRSLQVSLRPAGKKLAARLALLVREVDGALVGEVKAADLAGFNRVMQAIARHSECKTPRDPRS